MLREAVDAMCCMLCVAGGAAARTCAAVTPSSATECLESALRDDAGVQITAASVCWMFAARACFIVVEIWVVRGVGLQSGVLPIWLVLMVATEG